MNQFESTFLLGVTFLATFLADSAVADECWLGERFGAKVINYSNREVRQEFDAESCRATCSEDVSNSLQVCHRLGAPFVNNAEFGCFFKRKEMPAELVSKAPDDFYGCSEVCNCPEGTWYEGFRRRCVEPTGTAVENMPNGDKGGGYYVKDGYLFKDASEANCRMLPSGESDSKRMGAATSGQWTLWMNIDQPGGHGDVETLEAYIMSGKVCARPIDIQCRTEAGISWLEANQIYTCDKEIGGVCTNYTQTDGEKCLDYEVRFLCP